MDRLVKPNQSACIRGRLIHEHFNAVKLTAKLLHQNNRPAALLKIDISKAFDTVSWRFLIDLLKQMGFSRRWQNWISMILSSASTKIIVNGLLSRRICHARGLRQGDPLSPLPFVLTMEVLNALLKKADALGLLLPLDDRVKERVFLYADDVVLFLQPQQQDLAMTKGILEILSKAGCAVLIKSVLSAIPTHTAMVVDISPWAIKCIDKKRRAFLWKGSDEVKGGTACLLGQKFGSPTVRIRAAHAMALVEQNR